MSQTLGHYEILGIVGTGGLGTVYRARDTRVGRTVAIRVLGDAVPDPLHRTRFVHAIGPYTGLSHPHIATLFDVGEHEGRVYLVYEFVPGEKLATLIGSHPLNIRRALDLAVQVADALAESHANELMHGALTPTSIFVTPQGRAKILDFGLTSWYQDDGVQTAARLTARGAALGQGSVGYMSPEQVLGHAVDLRSDLFAFGAVLYAMLTGRDPFDAANTGDIGVKVLQITPEAPSRLNPDSSPELDAVVFKAIAKNPDDRYQSAASLAADLRSAAELIQARAPRPEPPRVVKRSGSTRVRTGVLAGLLIAALALGAWEWQDAIRQAWHARISPTPAPLVVVLPFKDGGSDRTRPYFGPGLAEDLAKRLAQVNGVTVIGRTSIRSFAARMPQTVAADVKASLALTGTITPADADWKTLRLRLSLVDRADGQSVWTGTYTAPVTDIIALQARIVRVLADWLRISYRPTAEQGRMALRLVDPAAFDLYLQARDAMASQDASRAVQQFESAISADPSLIEAQTGLAEALYSGAVFEGRLSYADARPRIRDAAEAASTTDPDAAPAKLAMGLAAPTVKEALSRLRAAIDADHSFVAAYYAIGEILRDIDPARSIRFATRALELDPTSAIIRNQLATANIAGGEFDQALVETARGQALAPGLPWWDALRARVHLARPSTRGTSSATAHASDAPPVGIVIASSLLLDNRTADALTLLASVARLYPGACEARALLAGVHLAAGDRIEGLRLGNQVLAEANAAADLAPVARCAAMAAAAIGDPSRTALWIGRAAATDEGIRAWAATNGLMSPQAAIHQNLYPWRNVLASPQVAAAVAAMDAGYVRTRGEAARALEGLLENASIR